MDIVGAQGDVLVCNPSPINNAHCCVVSTPSDGTSNEVKAGASKGTNKLKKRKPRTKNGVFKDLVIENCISPQVNPEDQSTISTPVNELLQNLEDVSLEEAKKPKKVRKRKKSSNNDGKKSIELLNGYPILDLTEQNSLRMQFLQNIKERHGESSTSMANYCVPTTTQPTHPHNPQNSQGGESPKNKPFFEDNRKLSGKKKQQSKKKKTNSEVFEDYLTPEEVERGLKDKTMVLGSIRINVRCYKEAYINSEGDEKDIMIEGLKDRNRALEGDEVVVLLHPPDAWKVKSGQRTGKVVMIKEKSHSRKCIGKLPSSLEANNKYVVFSPRDSRVPRIKIPLTDPSLPPQYIQSPEKYAETLFSAQITSWTDVSFAEGVILEEVGEGGGLEVETLAILLENNLDYHPIDPLLNIFFPTLPYKIPEEEIAKRLDLRRECIFTIDPATARDLDDAVSAKKLDNGNLEVGVHISDVSFFLTYNTLLDNIVSKRATTIYLVQRVYHMLPVELCQLCSLTSGEDKLAFSVFIELTPDAQVVSQRFARTVIHSCAKLAYEHAQMVIDNPEKKFTSEDFPEVCNNFTAEDCAERIRDLYKLSVIMRKRRFDSGALRIDQPKLCFHLDPVTQTPLNSFIYENKESHRLIEEFMLLANMLVAEHIYKAYPKLAFLRHHNPPRASMMIDLQKRLEQYGIHLDISNAGTIHSSMLKYSSPQPEEDEVFSWARYIVLNQLCAKPMLRANYFCPPEDLPEEMTMHHFALNAPCYTHFTSPIRRYADVMVHRLLAASLKLTPEPSWSHLDTKRIAMICNQKKLAAKNAGEQSSLLFLALFLNEPVESAAAVIDVKDRSADVIVKDFGVVLRVYTDPLPAKVEYSNEDNVSQLYIQWKNGGPVQLLQLFSVVRVQVSRAKDGLKLSATLLPPL